MDPESLKEKVESICRPAVEQAGFDLIMIQWATQSGRRVLRLYVESLEEDRPVTLDDCATISRQVSAALDVEDPVEGAYSLEVSSPGLNRPLVRPDHFRRFLGHRADLKLRKQEGLNRRRFKGVIRGVDEQSVTLEVDGDERTFDLASVERANLMV